MKRLGIFLLPPEWDASPLQGYRRSLKLAVTHLYTWAERGTVTVKCLALCPRSEFKPGRLDPETSQLTMRPPRNPLIKQFQYCLYYQFLVRSCIYKNYKRSWPNHVYLLHVQFGPPKSSARQRCRMIAPIISGRDF